MTSLQDEFSIGAVLGLKSTVKIQYFNQMWYVINLARNIKLKFSVPGCLFGCGVVVVDWGTDGNVVVVPEKPTAGDGLADHGVVEFVSSSGGACVDKGAGAVSTAGVGDNTGDSVVPISVGIWVVVPGSTIGTLHMVMNSASYVAVWTIVQF